MVLGGMGTHWRDLLEATFLRHFGRRLLALFCLWTVPARVFLARPPRLQARALSERCEAALGGVPRDPPARFGRDPPPRPLARPPDTRAHGRAGLT